MEKISNSDFLTWASNFGIALDGRYHPPQTLAYEHTSGFNLNTPKHSRELESLLTLVLTLVAGADIFVYKRGGHWLAEWYPDERLRLRIAVEDVHARVGLGDGEYSLKFGRDEINSLLCFVYLHVVTAWKSTDDLFLVPYHGRLMIYLDADDLVHVVCKETTTRDAVLLQLREIACDMKYGELDVTTYEH